MVPTVSSKDFNPIDENTEKIGTVILTLKFNSQKRLNRNLIFHRGHNWKKWYLININNL